MRDVEPNRLQDLIERARGRDESALEELVQMHAERLLEFVRMELGRRLRQRLESQDVIQQVLLDAVRNIEQFVDQGHDSFFAWLRRIAVNRICDADRKAFQTLKRRDEVRIADLGVDASMGRLLDAVAKSGGTPSEAAVGADRVELLRGALERLSADQREVIQLRYFSQMDVAETAERMGRSDRAVRSLCARALIRLRELLGHAV